MSYTYVLIPLIVLAVIVVWLTLYLASRYKRCPSDQILVIYGKVGEGNQRAASMAAAARLAADPGLAVPEPDADDDQHSAAERAFAAEHPHQRAQHVYGGHQHRPGIMNNAAERLLTCVARDRRDGQGNHFRPAASDGRVADDRADQPGPRELPGIDPQERRARTEQDRPVPDQRQHHRHHR